MFQCLDCTNSEDQVLAMCIVCKDTCHAGHRTTALNNGNAISAVCDCGKGMMKDSYTFDKIYFENIEKIYSFVAEQ